MSPGVIYTVYDMDYTPKYFDPREFTKIGCNIDDCDPASLRMLDRMRDFYGRPMVLTSAFRSTEQNSAVGGTTNSAHLRGLAYDVRCNIHERFNMVRAAILAGFTRIGIGKNFIHVDCDETLPSPRIWTY